MRTSGSDAACLRRSGSGHASFGLVGCRAAAGFAAKKISEKQQRRGYEASPAAPLHADAEMATAHDCIYIGFIRRYAYQSRSPCTMAEPLSTIQLAAQSEETEFNIDHLHEPSDHSNCYHVSTSQSFSQFRSLMIGDPGWCRLETDSLSLVTTHGCRAPRAAASMRLAMLFTHPVSC